MVSLVDNLNAMIFDPENHTFKLCARGIELEGENPREAAALFQQAWKEAENDFDKSVAAHYVARQQDSIENKLKWDETALQLALQSNDENIQGLYPSLYLNVGKGHEDLQHFEAALENYSLGLSFSSALEADGYGKMIRSGLDAGIERIHASTKHSK